MNKNISKCYHLRDENGQIQFFNHEKSIFFSIKPCGNNFSQESISDIPDETLRNYVDCSYDVVHADLKNYENINIILYNLARITKNNGYISITNNKSDNIEKFNLVPICVKENSIIAKKSKDTNKTALIDIIIVSYAKNNECKKVTLDCIKSLIDSEKNSEIIFNIIVVESNPNVNWDHISPCVKTYQAPLPYGYHKFLNFGRKKGKAEWVALCNNDLKFEPLWFTKILESSIRNKDVLSFSPICNYTQIKNGIKKNSGDLFGYQIRTHVSGWCIIQKRKIYDIIGDLDEKFIHWCCDSDYCLTLFKHELKHALVTDSIVNHHDQKIGITTVHSVKSIKEISDFTVGSKEIFDQKYRFQKPNFSVTKDKIINDLIIKNNYKKYLEIGVRDGSNIKKINCEVKFGVDPFPRSKDTTHVMTSDSFFQKICTNEKYDIILIDGLHTEEQVDKDIANSLLHLSEHGTIVLHDCNPPSEFHAKEIPFYDHPINAEWNGTVYKSLIKIKMHRTDLNLVTIDSDYGVGILTRNKSNLPTLNYTYPIDTWDFFKENKKNILNLMSYDEYKIL